MLTALLGAVSTNEGKGTFTGVCDGAALTYNLPVSTTLLNAVTPPVLPALLKLIVLPSVPLLWSQARTSKVAAPEPLLLFGTKPMRSWPDSSSALAAAMFVGMGFQPTYWVSL